VIQIVYILTSLSNGIEFGVDKLSEKNAAGNNLIKSTLLYLIISLVVILMFNGLASSILSIEGI
jgi:hypothetical protein